MVNLPSQHYLFFPRVFQNLRSTAQQKPKNANVPVIFIFARFATSIKQPHITELLTTSSHSTMD